MVRKRNVLLAVTLAVVITASAALSLFGLPSPARSGGTTAVQIISGPWSLLDPSVNPDGSTMAYVSNRSGGVQVWTMGLDGIHQTRLTYDTGVKSLPRWSSDGKMLAFLSRVGSSTNLLIMNADGTGVSEVTSDGTVGSFDWNPSSTEIAYDFSAGGNRSIWTVSPPGTASQITSGHDDVYPSWSPDGRSLVYSSNRSGSFVIYLLDLATRKETKLTGPGNSIEPRVSPYGDKLLFLSDRSGHWSIWKENLNGSGLKDLLNPNEMFRVPSWVPEIDRSAAAAWNGDDNSVTFLSLPTTAGVDVFNMQLSSPIPVNELGAVTMGIVTTKVTANITNVDQATWYPDGLVFVVSVRQGDVSSFWVLRFSPPVYHAPYGDAEPFLGAYGTD